MIAGAEEYLRFFGLQCDPFAATADPEFFYFTPQATQCLALLQRSVDARYGISLVVGPCGTGKTSLLRQLAARLSNRFQRYNVGVVSSPAIALSQQSLVEEVCRAFNVPVEGPLISSHLRSLTHHLHRKCEFIHTLLIDDAQNFIEGECLDLLCYLHDLGKAGRNLLSLVLFAQAEALPAFGADVRFEQHVNSTHSLNALTYEDSVNMIHFRLHKANPKGQGLFFDEDSLETIYEYSQGIPRQVVSLCRNAMLFARHHGQTQISNDTVLHAINDLTLEGSLTRDRLSEFWGVQ